MMITRTNKNKGFVLSVLKLEFYRAFSSSGFVLSMIVGLSLCLWAELTDLYNGGYKWLWDMDCGMLNNPKYHSVSSGVHNGWFAFNPMSVQMNIYSFIFPILAALPYATSLATDKNDGFIKSIAIRCDKVGYYQAKLLAVFFSSGVAVIVPFVVSFLFTCYKYPFHQPVFYQDGLYFSYHSLFGEVFYTNFPGFVVLKFSIAFITAGIFGLVALAFSLYIKSSFIVLVSPFIIWLFIKVMCTYLSHIPWVFSMNLSATTIFFQGIACINGVDLEALVVEELSVLLAVSVIVYLVGVKDADIY